VFIPAENQTLVVDICHIQAITPVGLSSVRGSNGVSKLTAWVLAFDIDTVKMLMNIFDTDRSGTIGFNEFAGLYKYIGDWQVVFHRFDRDRSGSIEGRELAEALRSFGYNLSSSLLTLIEQKYASGPSVQLGPPPGITFDRFVRACVAVKTLTEEFQRADTDRDGWVQLNYELFMKMVLSSP